MFAPWKIFGSNMDGKAGRQSWTVGLSAWLRGFVPAPVIVSKREKLYGCVGVWIGLLMTELVSQVALGNFNPWFIAPMGASAVLLFAMPSSPLAQPWSIIGGNLVSGLIGVSCARWISEPLLAASLAPALAIGAMFALRCLHPPSGAVALTAVLGGPAILASGYHFVLGPVLINSMFLLLAALVFNNLLRRRYPHPVINHANGHGTADLRPSERLGFTRADLDQALQQHDQMLDVNEDDLEELFLQAERQAYQRRFGEIRCADIMSTDVVLARQSMTPEQVWTLLSRHQLKALPVVDPAGLLIGIVTLHDLVCGQQEAAPVRMPQWRLAGSVADLMTRSVRTAQPQQSVPELVPLFSDEGFHHLPVVDAQQKVVGMLSQSDLVAALYRTRLENAESDLKTGRPSQRAVHYSL
jgi:CBS domain-containing membrane protein